MARLGTKGNKGGEGTRRDPVFSSFFQGPAPGGGLPPVAAGGAQRPSEKSLFALLLRLVGETLKAHPSLVVVFLTALVGLSVSQAAFLFGTKAFMKALFDPVARELIPLKDLLPFPPGSEGLIGRDSLTSDPAHLGWLRRLGLVEVPVKALTWAVPLYLLLAGLGQSISNYFYQVSQQQLGLLAAAHYREKLLSGILNLPFLVIQNRSPGQWMSLVMNDVLYLQNRITELSTALFKDSLLVLVSLVSLWFIHWPSAVVASALVPLMAWSMGRAGKKVTLYAEGFQAALGHIAAAVHDMRQRFEFVFAQNGQRREVEHFASLAQNYFSMMAKSLLIRAFLTPSMEWVGMVFFGGLLFIVGSGQVAAFNGETLIQLMVALGLLMRPVKEMGEQLARYHETKGILKSSLVVFTQIEAMGQGSRPLPPASPDLPASEQPLQIDTIVVSLHEQELISVKQELSLKTGQTFAIIGPSGAGKSTLIKCLAGLFEPSEWRGSVSWQSLVSKVSFVSQEPFLFHDSIRNNLLYGDLTLASRTSEQIWEALKEVGLDQEVGAMSLGLDTPVQTFTQNVSGGQLQRLVIARALLRGRPILLLDEATSAIDAMAEKKLLLNLIERVKSQKMILIAVTHRLQWLHLFDKVVFIEGGHLVYLGPHEALLQEPRYLQYCRAESDVL